MNEKRLNTPNSSSKSGTNSSSNSDIKNTISAKDNTSPKKTPYFNRESSPCQESDIKHGINPRSKTFVPVYISNDNSFRSNKLQMDSMLKSINQSNIFESQQNSSQINVLQKSEKNKFSDSNCMLASLKSSFSEEMNQSRSNANLLIQLDNISLESPKNIENEEPEKKLAIRTRSKMQRAAIFKNSEDLPPPKNLQDDNPISNQGSFRSKKALSKNSSKSSRSLSNKSKSVSTTPKNRKSNSPSPLNKLKGKSQFFFEDPKNMQNIIDIASKENSVRRIDSVKNDITLPKYSRSNTSSNKTNSDNSSSRSSIKTDTSQESSSNSSSSNGNFL